MALAQSWVLRKPVLCYRTESRKCVICYFYLHRPSPNNNLFLASMTLFLCGQYYTTDSLYPSTMPPQSKTDAEFWRARAILGERASRPLILKTNLSLASGRDARSPKVPVSTVHARRGACCKSSQPTTILSLGARGGKQKRRGDRACLFCSSESD